MITPLPKVAIVGRPNVGKSTLFNRLIGVKQAIVDDIPGVTRDRQYGTCDWDGQYFTVVDTGGFLPEVDQRSVEKAVRDQALLAVEEADAIVLVVDGRSGLVPSEEALAKLLRKTSKPVFLAVNKIDSAAQEAQVGEFQKLGFSHTLGISSETSRGVSDLLTAMLPALSRLEKSEVLASDLKLAIIGRPNVGKSTLLNALLGEERAVVHHQAGTTRDPLNVQIERGSRVLEIVDTAGIKRKAQTKGKLEKVSVLKALKSVDKSHMVLALLDATEGMTAQDAKVLSYAQERGKGVLLVLNKWDLVDRQFKLKDFRERFDLNYKRNEYVPLIAISAKTRRNLSNLYKLIDQVHENYLRRVGTGELNRVFQSAVRSNPHPTTSGQNIHLTYVTQSGWGPPTFVLFANKPKLVSRNYLRYLENVFRKKFEFTGSPIRWVIRQK